MYFHVSFLNILFSVIQLLFLSNKALGLGGQDWQMAGEIKSLLSLEMLKPIKKNHLFMVVLDNIDHSNF